MDRDTDPRRRAYYLELLRRMSPAQRLAAASRLSSGIRTLALAGLRQRHPGESEEQLRVRLTVRLYGKEVARRIHHDVPEDAV
jgi:hypothetical protein